MWDEAGNSVATIESTEEEEDASATAKLFAEAKETKEQHGKMLEALKAAKKAMLFSTQAGLPTFLLIQSLIKEIEES